MTLRSLFAQAFWTKPLPSPASTGAEHEAHPGAKLNFIDVLLMGIGGTVGTGVFATSGKIAALYAGPAAILSWLLSGLGCLLSGLAFMELSAQIPSTGSSYAYAYHALGEFPALVAGFLLTLEYGVSSAGGARAWSQKLQTFLVSHIGVNLPSALRTIEPSNDGVDCFAGLLLLACVLINLCGLQAGKIVVNSVTLTKIGVVLFVIIGGVVNFDASNLTPFLPPGVSEVPSAIPMNTTDSLDTSETVYGWPGVVLGASASFYGYIGFDEICCMASEVKDARKTVPQAVFGTIIGTMLLSTMATFALVGMQSFREIDVEESFGSAFEANGWHVAGTIVNIGELLTMPITTFIGFLAQPRVCKAMAQDGLLPSIFMKPGWNGDEPVYSILLSGIAVILIALFVPFGLLWSCISLGILVAFVLTNCSVMVLRLDKVERASPGRGASRGKKLLMAYLVCSFIAAFHVHHQMMKSDNAISPFDEYMVSLIGSIITVVFSAASIGLVFVLSCEGSVEAKSKEIELAVKEKSSPQEDTPSEEKEESGAMVENYSISDSTPVSDTGFRAPFGPWPPCLAIFINWLLIAQLSSTAALMIGCWMFVAFLLYAAYGSRNSLAKQQLAYHKLDAPSVH